MPAGGKVQQRAAAPGKSLGTVMNAQSNAFIWENTTAVISQDSFCKEKSPLAICRGF